MALAGLVGAAVLLAAAIIAAAAASKPGQSPHGGIRREMPTSRSPTPTTTACSCCTDPAPRLSASHCAAAQDGCGDGYGLTWCHGPFVAGREYASHLTDADLRLLASVADAAAIPVRGAAPGARGRLRLRGDPEALLRLLEHPGMFRAVLGARMPPLDGRSPASPFLVFAVLVQRAAAELASMDHVPERTGPRQRVPVFDAPALRDFLGEPARRLFLAELLASFTRVASGRYRVRVGGRMRTRRFSELDPVRLAGLLDGGAARPNGPACTAGSAT